MAAHDNNHTHDMIMCMIITTTEMITGTVKIMIVTIVIALINCPGLIHIDIGTSRYLN